MRVPSSQQHNGIQFDQAMTPMIDVVFLLLIFFVCASVGQMAESKMTVDLSSGGVESETKAPTPKEPWITEVWLKLKRDEINQRTTVEMNGREFVAFEPLESDLRALAELSPDSPIILDIAGEVPAGDVIRVDDACRAAGFQSINYATEPEKLKAN